MEKQSQILILQKMIMVEHSHLPKMGKLFRAVTPINNEFKIPGTYNEKIQLAPPRETLKIFGGFYNISEFRKASNKGGKTYNIINPPMISIVPKIEENIINYKLRDTDSFIPLNKELVRKAGDSLKIKRQKARTNTLKKYMNLQIE